MILSGWGRYPSLDCPVFPARHEGDVRRLVNGSVSVIARGAGRAYGDAALNADGVLSALPMNRFLAFDPVAGTLTCEAGVALDDILDAFVPRGWFPMVVPGLRAATIGGALAADVHGKNHHRDGCFGDHTLWLDLLTADGRVTRCGPDRESRLFRATRGGMGLTGVILRAAIRLRRIETALIRQETLRLADLDSGLDALEASDDWTYNVAWIDCRTGGKGFGRSVLTRGEHARVEELPRALRADPLRRSPLRLGTVPCDLPPMLALNAVAARLFNEAYFRASRPGEALIGLDRFFFPLDGLSAWNRLYGRAGLLQHQCVLPRASARAGLRALLNRIAAADCRPLLAVLKRMGPRRGGFLSFPIDGHSLALDFPVSPASLALCDDLDAIVADCGGRLYLAKDARMSAAMMRKGYPELEQFSEARAAWDADGRFRSRQSERLGL